MDKRGSYLLLGIYIFLFGIVIVGSIIYSEKMSLTGLAVGGACASDSDSAVADKFSVKGDIKDASSAILHTDSCANDNITLTEYSCTTSIITSESKDCSTNYAGCLAGACVLCYDPDVGETSHLKNTTVIGLNTENQETTSSDSCVDTTKLTEYSCAEDETIASQEIDCSTKGEGFACANGKCKCVPNWWKTYTNCTAKDTNTTYWIDLNNCGEAQNASIANITNYCDYNNNSIIGEFNSFSSKGMSLTAYVNNSAGDISKIFNGTQKVELKESGKTRIEFNWNFNQAPLNMYEINISKQSSTEDQGYLIVNNLEISKTIFIDRLNNESNSVCIKDTEVSSIDEVSSDCGDSDEILVPCPGTKTNITCEISENKYKISGIKHSAVIEFDEPTLDVICQKNMSCGTWSDCLNGIQTRTCTDLNDCEDDKIENQTCEEKCVPKWECTAWSPKECPKSGEQTMTCTDSNDCGTDEGKPNESRSCTPKSSISGMFILLIVLIIGAVIGIIILIIKLLGKGASPSGGPASNMPPRPPFNPIPPALPNQVPRMPNPQMRPPQMQNQNMAPFSPLRNPNQRF